MDAGDEGAQTLLERVSVDADAQGLTRTAEHVAVAKKP
jgi:hypothetical protein